METSGQIHAPAALPRGKSRMYPMGTLQSQYRQIFCDPYSLEWEQFLKEWLKERYKRRRETRANTREKESVRDREREGRKGNKRESEEKWKKD
jgi:hypothetical protein